MTRITPRREITLQCSQIGRTLERTFKRGLQTKSGGPRKSCSPISKYRRGRKCTQEARLRRASQLGEQPARPQSPKPEEHRPVPLVRRASDHEAAIQLHEPAARLDLADRRDHEILLCGR